MAFVASAWYDAWYATVADAMYARARETMMCGIILSTAEREKIKKRSIKLLNSWLKPKQREQYKAAGWFDVVGSDGGNYRITDADQCFNVWEIGDGGEVLREICFIPKQTNGVGDTMLCQKIYLEIDEKAMLAIANHRLPKSRDSITWATSWIATPATVTATEAAQAVLDAADVFTGRHP